MKKLIAFALVVVMAFSLSIAFAEINLKELSYDELIDIQKTLLAEIMSRPEWKSVEVPQGHWRVGEDIPAGTYSIRATEKSSAYLRVWGAEYEDWQTNGGLIFNDTIRKGETIGKIELKEGWLIDIDDTVYFEPPKGLGF